MADLRARIIRAAERIAEAAEAQAGASRLVVRRRAEEVARAELTLLALALIDELAGVDPASAKVAGCRQPRCILTPAAGRSGSWLDCRCPPRRVAEAYRAAVRRHFQ